jgi:hypothetical protein
MIDNIMLKKNAHQNPSTVKPDTMLDAIKMIIVLITNRNKPSVITVKGSVKKISTGFKKIFRIAKINAIKIAVPK